MVPIFIAFFWYIIQQRFGENMGQLLDPNHASILKSAAAPGQPSGYRI